jgi:uncharacterized OsmC-like protein
MSLRGAAFEVLRRDGEMYAVDIANSGGYCFKVKAKEYEFNVDMKGKQGISPPDTLLASIGTCIGVYIRKYAEGAKLSIPGFKINVEADYDQAQPLCFRKINVKLDLRGAEFDERRLNAMLGFIKNCPVHNTLKINPEVEIKIN